jgi:hypothetical protein
MYDVRQAYKLRGKLGASGLSQIVSAPRSNPSGLYKAKRGMLIVGKSKR